MQPDYASIVETINALATYRSIAALGSEPYDRLVEQERALRVSLASTPEQKQMQRAWRMLVDANKRRKRAPVMQDNPLGPRSA